MAITVAQLYEIESLTLEAQQLVDLYEQRDTEMVNRALSWLKKLESALEKSRLSIVSKIAALHAMLIQASRGQQPEGIYVKGKITRKKLAEATLCHVLNVASETVLDTIKDRKTVIEEGERLALHIVNVLNAKQLLTGVENLGHIVSVAKSDKDTISVWVHLTGLVGIQDAMILLDQALPKVNGY